MYTNQPQQDFYKFLIAFFWAFDSDPFKHLYFPLKPDWKFFKEECIFDTMGRKWNGSHHCRVDNSDRPLFYRTFIKGNDFYLEIDGKEVYQVLSISIGTSQNAKMVLLHKKEGEITLWGYKGDFNESIFGKNYWMQPRSFNRPMAF